MVLDVGKHSATTVQQRRRPVALAALIAPAAFFIAAGADVSPQFPEPVAQTAPPPEPEMCCAQVVAAPIAFSAAPNAALAGVPVVDETQSASRWRIVKPVEPVRPLPRGVAPEEGLQVKTIYAARAVSAVFPEIKSIGGVRPDAMRWHPEGLAIDIMVPNPSSAAGIALGNKIVAFVLKNAVRFSLQDVIWRGVYYTPAGPRGSDAGHYDHIHITTHGGGYPKGGELYFR